MTQQGNDFREWKEEGVKNATISFGKYKGKKILECNDSNYWEWLKGEKYYNYLSKFEKKAVRIMCTN